MTPAELDAVATFYSFIFRKPVGRHVITLCDSMVCWTMGHDPLRDAVEEARPHRLPLIAYCVVQQGGHFLKAHPEWEMRGADGKPIGRFCYNSGYLEAMKQIVAEQLAYGIHGFHIDMVDQGFGPPYGCWCDTCRSQFEKEFGQAMPAGATWDAAWDRMLELSNGFLLNRAIHRHRFKVLFLYSLPVYAGLDRDR